MYIVIVAVDKIYRIETAQIPEGLLHGESMSSSELQDEYHRPFHLVTYIISHGLSVLFLQKITKELDIVLLMMSIYIRV